MDEQKMRKCVVLGCCVLPLALLLGACASNRQVAYPNRDVYDRKGGQAGVSAKPAGGAGSAASPKQAQAALSGLNLASPGQVDERIFSYEQRHARLKTLEDRYQAEGRADGDAQQVTSCVYLLENLLDRYYQMREYLLREENASSASPSWVESFLRLQQDDIAFVEGDCAPLIRTLAPTVGGAPAPPGGESASGNQAGPLPAAEQSVLNAWREGQHWRVIDAYQLLLATQPAAPRLSTTMLYAESLAGVQRHQDALVAYQDLLTGVRAAGGAAREYELLRRMGELHLLMEDFSGARQGMEELKAMDQAVDPDRRLATSEISILGADAVRSGEQAAYVALLRSFLGQGADLAGEADRFLRRFPSSALAWRVMEMREGASTVPENGAVAPAAGEAVASPLPPVDSNATVPALPGQVAPTGAETADSALPADPSLGEAPLVDKDREARLQEQWDTAMANLEVRQYDKAMEIFRALEETSYGDQARVQLAETANQAAQEDRQKAAEYFFKARNTSDPANKRQLLESARQLLEDILVKYPQADVIDKVNRNLDTIRVEIARLGEAPASGGGLDPVAPAVPIQP